MKKVQYSTSELDEVLKMHRVIKKHVLYASTDFKGDVLNNEIFCFAAKCLEIKRRQRLLLEELS